MLVRGQMNLYPAGRRPMSPESRAGLGAAVVLLALVSVVEIADGERPNYLGLLAA
ncbi:MAG TPA: serine/threonine-protein phosphatase, partial [Micromonosporaceae bacterium]|nr:serine/threonine-protein phosphatase [Micromonosporaceae bacterium]